MTTKQNQDTIVQKELPETCPQCKSKTIEEKLDYKGKLYAVSVCTKCSYFDWSLPEGIEDASSVEFQESEEWARDKAKELRLKHKIMLIPVGFSGAFLKVEADELRKPLNDLADSLGYKSVYVKKYYHGIKIEMSK